MRMNAPLAYRRIYFPKGSNMKGRGAYWVARTTDDSLTTPLEANNTSDAEKPPTGRGIVIRYIGENCPDRVNRLSPSS